MKLRYKALDWSVRVKKKKKKVEEKHILVIFWAAVPVQEMLCFSVLTSFRILAITCSFQIRFE